MVVLYHILVVKARKYLPLKTHLHYVSLLLAAMYTYI